MKPNAGYIVVLLFLLGCGLRCHAVDVPDPSFVRFPQKDYTQSGRFDEWRSTHDAYSRKWTGMTESFQREYVSAYDGMQPLLSGSFIHMSGGSPQTSGGRSYSGYICLLIVLLFVSACSCVAYYLRRVPARQDAGSLPALAMDRMELLDEILVHKAVQGNGSGDVEKRVLKMINDKDNFLSALADSFELRHPSFVSKLTASGLNKNEVGYCCMIALGVTSKEMESFSSHRQNYETISSIRSKLGLTGNGQKLKSALFSMIDN